MSEANRFAREKIEADAVSVGHRILRSCWSDTLLQGIIPLPHGDSQTELLSGRIIPTGAPIIPGRFPTRNMAGTEARC